MMYDLNCTKGYDLATDTYTITYTWKQYCKVCGRLTPYVLRRRALEPLRPPNEHYAPKYVDRVCSQECENVRQINPLPYE